MPSKTATRLGRCVGAVALALGALAGPLAAQAAAASVVTSSSVLAPSLVSTGRAAFYSATWVNQGHPTVANPEVVITLPAGSAVVSADPAVCSVSAPSRPSRAVVVTCERENLAAGASITQQLLIQVPTVSVSINTAVTAILIGDEKTHDSDKSHTDTFPAPDQALAVLSGDADAAGGCLRNGEAPLATRPGLSAANPLITTAGLAGPSGQLCAPVTVQERAATSPTDACGAGARCTTDIAVTDFIQVAQPASAPVQLTFTVVASNRNITWYKNGAPVADCRGATALPTGADACVNSRSTLGPTCVSSRSMQRSAGVRLGVLWRAGADPTWRG